MGPIETSLGIAEEEASFLAPSERANLIIQKLRERMKISEEAVGSEILETADKLSQIEEALEIKPEAVSTLTPGDRIIGIIQTIADTQDKIGKLTTEQQESLEAFEEQLDIGGLPPRDESEFQENYDKCRKKRIEERIGEIIEESDRSVGLVVDAVLQALFGISYSDLSGREQMKIDEELNLRHKIKFP